MRSLAGNLHLHKTVTTASAMNAAAAFAPASYAQRQPVATSNAFSQEFEGCSTAQGRTPSRATSATPKTKDNNVAQVAVATPVTAAIPQMLPVSLFSGGTDAGDDTLPAASALNSDSLPSPAAPDEPETAQPTDSTTPAPPPTAFMLRMQAAAAGSQNGLQQAIDDEGDDVDPKKADDGSGQDSAASALQSQSALTALVASRPVDVSTNAKQPTVTAPPPELAASRVAEHPRAPQPLNNLLMQVNPPGSEKVLVRLVQQSGELRLAVHTDDSELSHGLQQGLSELTGKLQENGYRTDTWQPAQSSQSPGLAMESHNASNHSRQGDSQPQSGSQQHGGEQRQNQSNRPKWVQELESSLTSTGRASGESYGFSS